MSTPLLQELRKIYGDIYIIVAPPRCSATAFARVFWEHPSLGFYCHEPFDLLYYENQCIDDAIQNIFNSMALDRIKSYGQSLSGLVIKETSFQVGANFSLLSCLTQKPILFVVRNPIQSIASRMEMLGQGGESTNFPLIESGWNALSSQIKFCQNQQKPYYIIDSDQFRGYPLLIFNKIFNRLGLSFSENFSAWKSLKGIELGRLGEKQRHWYNRVLLSTGIQAPNKPISDTCSFSNFYRLQIHVKECMTIYDNLRNDVNFILP
jgi:hypothetical protein